MSVEFAGCIIPHWNNSLPKYQTKPAGGFNLKVIYLITYIQSLGNPSYILMDGNSTKNTKPSYSKSYYIPISVGFLPILWWFDPDLCLQRPTKVPRLTQGIPMQKNLKFVRPLFHVLIWVSLKIEYTWLAVLTILKNISQWQGLSHILWKKKQCLKPPTI